MNSEITDINRSKGPADTRRAAPKRLIFPWHLGHSKSRTESPIACSEISRAARRRFWNRFHDRLPRSVWSAWSLLPLLRGVAPHESAGKPDALQTLRDTLRPGCLVWRFPRKDELRRRVRRADRLVGSNARRSNPSSSYFPHHATVGRRCGLKVRAPGRVKGCNL